MFLLGKYKLGISALLFYLYHMRITAPGELTIDDVRKASMRIAPYINATPIVSSSMLNERLRHEIFFKLESMQKIGAFKARGACNTLAWLKEQGLKPKRVVANSSGNHAQAVAWAAGQFGIPATIFMPAYSSKIKIQATWSYGAEVVLCDSRNSADEQVADAAREKDTFWLHPFDHPQVIAGQGTSTLEALEELGNIDAVFSPCGGGGLLSGTLIAAKGMNNEIAVVGAEPLNANDAAESLRTGKIESLTEVPDTLADGAMTTSVGEHTFAYLQQTDAFYEVEESLIAYWTQWLTHLLKTHIEPTGALAMVISYFKAF